MEESGNSGVSQTSTQESSSSTPASSVTESTQSSSGSVDLSSPVSEGNANLAGIPAAYQPNFKFKAYGQEYEIPEFVRQAVKDQATEKQLKEIFEKAYGLEVMKPKLEKSRTDLGQVQSEYKRLKNNTNQLGMYIQNRDFDSFFDALKVPVKDLQSWMLMRLQEQELPPHAQAEIQRARQIQRDNYSLYNRNQELSETALGQQEQAKIQELQSVFTRPDVQAVMSSFDQRQGAGSFEREVIRRAAMEEQLYGKRDVSAEAVVNDLLAMLGGQTGANNAPVPPAFQPPQGNGQGQTPATGKPPVIPNVGGKNSSPAKKLPRSLDDLRKLAKEASL